MSEDPAHPWGTGATRYRWRPSVERLVNQVERHWPQVRINTYVCHPWCGWSDVSFDVWHRPGRGTPLLGPVAEQIRRFLMQQPGHPLIRHTILDHQLWTSWGGYSYWRRNDHTGQLRHLHVTYWPATT